MLEKTLHFVEHPLKKKTSVAFISMGGHVIHLPNLERCHHLNVKLIILEMLQVGPMLSPKDTWGPRKDRDGAIADEDPFPAIVEESKKGLENEGYEKH